MTPLLFVPAHNVRFIEKAQALDCEVVLDLEDGCPPSRRIDARHLVNKLARPTDWVRINRGSWAQDIDCLPLVHGVVVPKAHPLDNTWPLPEGLQRMSIIETAPGLEYVREIAKFSDALIVGLGDLAAHLCTDELDQFARHRVLLAARAHGILAYDAPCTSFRDEMFQWSAKDAHLMGFDGQVVLHPRAVAAVHSHGRLTQEEEEECRVLASGSGIELVGTRLVAPPHRRRAQWELERGAR